MGISKQPNLTGLCLICGNPTKIKCKGRKEYNDCCSVSCGSTLGQRRMMARTGGVHPNTDALSTIDFANWTHAYDKRSAQEVLEADQEKVYCAEEMGYNILSVWSKDHDNFSKATNFIRTHYDCQNRAPQCQDN